MVRPSATKTSEQKPQSESRMGWSANESKSRGRDATGYASTRGRDEVRRAKRKGQPDVRRASAKGPAAVAAPRSGNTWAGRLRRWRRAESGCVIRQEGRQPESGEGGGRDRKAMPEPPWPRLRAHSRDPAGAAKPLQ